MAEGIPKKKTLGIHVLVIRPDARAEGLGASVRCRCSRIGPRYRGAGATFTDKVGATVTDPVVYRRLWIRSVALKSLLFLSKERFTTFYHEVYDGTRHLLTNYGTRWNCRGKSLRVIMGVVYSQGCSPVTMESDSRHS